MSSIIWRVRELEITQLKNYSREKDRICFSYDSISVMVFL